MTRVAVIRMFEDKRHSCTLLIQVSQLQLIRCFTDRILVKDIAADGYRSEPNISIIILRHTVMRLLVSMIPIRIVIEIQPRFMMVMRCRCKLWTITPIKTVSPTIGRNCE